MKKKVLVLGLMLVFVFAMTIVTTANESASNESASDEFEITVNIVQQIAVEAQNIDFGTIYDTSVSHEATTDFTVFGEPGQDYTVELADTDVTNDEENAIDVEFDYLSTSTLVDGRDDLEVTATLRTDLVDEIEGDFSGNATITVTYAN